MIKTDRKQRNYNKSGKLERKSDQKRIEAEVRQEAYKRGEAKYLGTKEKVKAGIITPCEALVVVPVGNHTHSWLTRRKKRVGCVK